jgi:hypothetical protein
MVTAASNGKFVSVTEATKIAAVTLLPLQRYKKRIGYIATIICRGIRNCSGYLVTVTNGKY